MSDKLTKEQSNNTEKPQSKYILPEKMKSLEDVITRIHSEADFISTAFGVHTNKVMESFKSAITTITETSDTLELPIEMFKENNDRLEALINTLVILPSKTEEILSGVQDKVAKSVAATIPNLVDTLCKSHNDNYRKIHGSIDSCIQDLSHYINEARTHTQTELIEYKQEIANLIECGIKQRTRRIFLILMLSGSFSAIVSGVTSWVINKHFPRSVEITGNQHLVVKDSQVLVHGSDTYKLEKQRKEGK